MNRFNHLPQKPLDSKRPMKYSIMPANQNLTCCTWELNPQIFTEGFRLSLFIFNLVLCCTIPIISWINYDRRKSTYKVIFITLAILEILAIGALIFAQLMVTDPKNKMLISLFSLETMAFLPILVSGRLYHYKTMSSLKKRRLRGAYHIFIGLALLCALFLLVCIHYMIEFL